MHLAKVIINFVEEIRHDCLVKIQLLLDILFVPLEGLAPCPVFNLVIILDHARVLLRFQVTAIIEWFHTSDPLRIISDKPVASDVNLAFHCWLHHGFHHARLAVTVVNCAVLTSAVILVGRLDKALTLGDQIVLKVSPHLSNQALTVLFEQFS